MLDGVQFQAVIREIHERKKALRHRSPVENPAFSIKISICENDKQRYVIKGSFLMFIDP
jgi:hypothetical protein